MICVRVFSDSTCGYSCACERNSFYRKFNSDKINSIFLYNFIERICSNVRAYREKTRLLAKEYLKTPDSRERDQGVPNPWFTGPPFNRKSMENFMNELFLNGETKKYGTIRSDRVETRSTFSALRWWQNEYSGRRYAFQDFSPPTFGAVKTYN